MIVISIFFVGVLLGSLSKKYQKVFSVSEILTSVSLYLLLLFLGISIGKNDDIVSNIANLGFKGLLFALASALASILMVIPLYLIFPKRK